MQTLPSTIPPGLSSTISRIGAELEEAFPSKDPLLGLSDAADLANMSTVTFKKWVSAGFIPGERQENGRNRFRASTCETVKCLRVDYGTQWIHHVPWEAGAKRPPPRILTREGFDQTEVESDVDETSQINIDAEVNRRLACAFLERAKQVRDQGKHDTAYQLLWLYADALEGAG